MNHKYSFTIVTIMLIMVFAALGIYEARASILQTNINLSAALPMILKNWQDQDNKQQTPSPSGSLYVFFSNATITGNGAGGRTGMNYICSITDSSSHFCSKEELENAVQTTGAYFNIPFTESGWLDSIYSENDTPPISWMHGGHNCNGWTSAGTEGYTFINGGIPGRLNCSEITKVTCCKWIP